MTATRAAGPPSGNLRRLDDLPGPRGWPVVGNLFQLRRDVIHQDVERWCQRYGALFRFRIGRRQLVVVSDHALIAEVLRDRPQGWRRTQQMQVTGREMGLARWLGEGGSQGKRVTTPFGAGPRICPGRYLALTEMKMMLAMLLTRFHIESVTAPGREEAEERMSFTMVPVGLRMRLRAR